MTEKDILNAIINATLGTFEQRQSFTPGMFEPLKGLFGELGYENAVVYITDDYPDHLHAECSYGKQGVFPPIVDVGKHQSIMDALSAQLGDRPGLMTGLLYNHSRELGAIAATHPAADDPDTMRTFASIVRAVSFMAYVERIRTNSRRERLERDVFFAQSLTNRLLIREPPKLRDFKFGIEFVRSLEAGGDFFDFIPTANGVIGYLGCCNGKGLRTVLEVCSIMRRINRLFISTASLPDITQSINSYLVDEKLRSHQASLCIFSIDTQKQRINLVKAGRLGLLLVDPDKKITNASSQSGMFLGMMKNPTLFEESYDFGPGYSLLCVTEGFFNCVNILNAPVQTHWLLDALEDTVTSRNRIPLANAVFKRLEPQIDYCARQSEPMLALSVEFKKRNGTTMVTKT